MYCNLCNAEVTFASHGVPSPAVARVGLIGGGVRPHALCPACRCLDRERLVALYLQARLSAPATVLHVAPERGLARLLRSWPLLHHVTVDARGSCARAAVAMRLEALALRSACADIVICNHVLEHIADDRAAIAEIRRVMRLGAWGILQVPIGAKLLATYEDHRWTAADDREREFGQHDHVRIYGMDYVSRLTAAGFCVESIPAGMVAGPAAVSRHGLIPEECLFVVTKC